MSMTRPLACAVSLACLAAGLVIGRWTAPARREQVVVDREVYAGSWARGVSYVQTSAIRTNVKIFTRWKPTPAGYEVEQTQTTASQEDTHAEAQEHETAVETMDRTHAVQTRVEVKPVWRATAMAGLRDSRLLYGASLEHRLIGPVSAGLWFTSDKAYGAQLSLTW